MTRAPRRPWTAALLVLLPSLAACPAPPPLPGGPPPEFESPRAFALPGEGPGEAEQAVSTAAPSASAAPPAASMNDAPPAPSGSAASAPSGSTPSPSTWTSTSTETVAVAPGAGDPIPADGRVGAKHLLVMYKGSRLAPPSITRSKEEARKRADACLAKAKAPGAKFEDVVTECTDEPHGAKRGGDLFTFKPGVMEPSFSKGVLDTKVGQLSPVVESPFGFHVILRTR